MKIETRENKEKFEQGKDAIFHMFRRIPHGIPASAYGAKHSKKSGKK